MSRTLFIGLGRSAVCHYRCRLPAEAMGQDWVGVNTDFGVETGNTGGRPDIDQYDTVVCQQPRGPKWEERIARLKAKGKRVIYETDDYLHGIRMQSDHAFTKDFTPAVMREYDRCMAACDEVVVSTKFLAERYRQINPHITVCRNGIDAERYDYERPTRDYITVGWAGATGHDGAVRAWLEGGILEAMEDHPTSQFLAIGQPGCAGIAVDRLGEYRAMGIPWGPLETYPAAMASIDILLAPTGQSKWYRGKSDLRWLEAGALGLPCICGPYIYPDAEYIAPRPEDAGLILRRFLEQPDRIAAAGKRARQRVLEDRAFPAAVEPWRRLLS